LPAALNFTLTGNPNFNSDIGGFFAGDYNATWNDGTASKNPLFQELYVRWLQFGAFNPMMRSHGTDLKREIYYFGKRGEPIYDAIAKTIEFRYSLLPYIYSTSWQVTNNQDSFMKALVMDFPEDEKVWDLGDQFMFGDSFLVAPVLEAHYTPEKIVKVDEEEGWNKTDSKESNSKVNGNFTETKSAEIYLPEGSKWVDYWTGDYFDGGQQIEKETTINTIPLYVKAGSIIPVGPNVQYATEKSWDDLEVKIYTGADGEFVLYEDEFDNYNYEDGIYSTIKFSWDESSNSLKIGKRDGSFPGMLKGRKFKLVKISEGKQSLEKEINYSGEEEVVKFD
ncbi:MAG: glycoside hydrolase family 31 protein, partial [Christiangramia sp.]|nr:glycoside hydrolase family 31 protein [Christiangramia sp.]